MTRPDPASFAVVAALSGYEPPADLLAAAAAGHAAMWDATLALRAVQLDLVDAIEPGHAAARLTARRPDR